MSGPLRRSSNADPASAGSGGLLRQIALLESANGLPHGPAAIFLAFLLALVVYPVARLVPFLLRR